MLSVPDSTMQDADTIRLEVPATYKYLNVLGACISAVLGHVEGLADPAMVTYHVQLAVHEICTNIVQHAYAGQPDGRIVGTLALVPEPRRLVVELQDTGRSFDPDVVPAPDLDAAPEGGYGLYLVRHLMDDVSYHPRPGDNRWHLVKNV